MEPYGSDVIITPRLYQTELEEIAVRKNTIIHLPTGSGKTYIAIRLIKRLRDALQKPWGEGGKRCFFLVNTVPLVIQQKKMVEYMCPVDGVAGFSSENRVDLWDKSKWDIELSKHQVIVATSQILCDMLTHQYISLSDINLIIFDECHHAVEDHPMRLIMKHFENCPKQEQPRILGLTATLLNGNVKLNKVEEILRELETTFQATIATANDMGEVAPHSTNPKEILQHYRNPALNSATQEAIALLKELQCIIISVKLPHSVANPNIRLKPEQRDITEKDGKKIIKEVKNMIESMILTINEMGAYGGAIGILAYVIAFERRKRWAQSEQEELLFNVAITHSTEARVVLLQSMAKETGYERIVKHSSERILQLLNILKEYSPGYVAQAGALMKINHNKSALSGLILTKQRFTAKVLYNLLKDVKEVNPIDFGFLKHDFIVGFNINPFTNTREQYFTKKLNQQALLKFRNGNLNCLISTSVLEEGVDIPQCLLVVRYDIPLEYRSYMQSKGRARSKESSYVVLVDREIEAKFRSQYIEFQKIEEYVHKLLHGNPHDRDAPTEEDVQAGLYNDDDVPPYCTETGIQLSGTDAIRLLFRYCSRLPHDQFTNITPMWVQEKIKEKNMIELYRLITIYMPLQCPVKEPIQGLPYVNLKTAKRSAALNVCKRLHEVGELDEVTLLPRQYGKIDFNQEDVKVCFLNWKDEDEHVGTDVPKPGFKKRMRKHPKVYPKCLDGPTKGWQNDNVLYLHVIRLSVAFKEPTDSRERVLYNLLRQKEGYGFVTNQPLPILCSFPIFLTVGEVKTSLEVNYAKIVITSDHFELIKRFHFFVFDQVLEVAKKFLMFDGAVDNLYVVPLKVVEDGYDIDWSFMGGHPEIEPVTEPAVSDRESLVVSNETYLNAVVTPWYRGSILPDRYIVSAILEYKTPQSRFESASFETFEDYYSSKHNLQIYGPKDQPLLEVRSINSRMNCLLPRAATINALTDKQRKLVSHAQGDDSPRRFDEIFVPEFCIKDEYPGVLWYKAILLPSIVHRLSMLLSAEELRDQIAKDTIKGYKPLVKGEEWLPIEIDLHMAVKSLLSNIEEPTAVNSIDRINNPIDAAPRTPNIMSVKESVYQLQKKKLTKEYPWDERNEPIDIDRTLSTVTVMDIECFDAFVTAPLHAEVATSPSRVLSPPRVVPGSAAILPPPVKYDDKIAILSKTPTTRGPELRDIVAALTTINSHDTFNLERAETLGDSFLKFAATLYLFHKFPALDEGQLTNIKGRLIGNRNLYYAGERAQLGGRMKVEQFSPRRDFVVPGFAAPPQVADFIEERCIRPTFLIGMQFPTEDALSGELSDEGWDHIRQRFEDWENRAETEPYGQAQNSMQCYIRHQAVSDKSVADSVEALIGTYLCSGGIASAVSFLEWMRILPPKDNFMGYLNRKVETVITQGKNTVTEVDWLLNQCRGDIENILNYKFKDPALLLEALSHASYIRNRYTRSYERLEFLGDAILDFLITSHIYENSPKLKPGELTDLRSSLVNNVTFASYVVKLGLHKFLCTQMNASLENAIKTFVEHQEERGHEIVEDVLYLIDEEDCRIAQYIDVPKTLSDIFESLAGAIYLDTGGDLQTVWSVVYRIMYKEINAFTLNIPKQPVRVLMETIHACPSFGETKQTTSGIPKIMIPVTFTKQGIQHTAFGVGTNKSQAKRAAAKLALKILAV